jgi:hypothetical protein
MRTSILKTALLSFLLAACQPAASQTVTVIDGDQILALYTDERIPVSILSDAGISLAPEDSILVNGIPLAGRPPTRGISYYSSNSPGGPSRHLHSSRAIYVSNLRLYNWRSHA